MKAKVTFHNQIQNTQDVTPSDPNQHYMISQAFFTLEVGGNQYSNMSVVLRHPYGTDYTKEPIEVETPSLGSYTGNWNYYEFRDTAEDYYRSALGMAIHIGPGSNVRMRNNLIGLRKVMTSTFPTCKAPSR